ncbi:unnamed protein product [Symbiodinium microadriaticum]|nr:unnamed protein product [Symbiodinium sp. KB8]CAE7864455.1 unnamed protein product [Symbiodinium microadriaticum]
MSFLRPLILAFAAVPCLEAIVWNGKDGSDSNVVAAIDLSSIPDCTDDLIAGGEAQCDSLSKDECKGYTQWDDSGKLFIQCKPSGENCLAEGPQCKKPPKKNHWIKPKSGVVCTKACKDNGFTKCNKKEMAKIDSKEKVKKAMKEAGYTCRSVGGHRNYAGIPFTTFRSGDECYYVTPGTKASSISCDKNKYGSHGPLCYCE